MTDNAPGLARADPKEYGSAMLDSFKIDISHQEMERIIVELELLYRTQPGKWLPIAVRGVVRYPTTTHKYIMMMKSVTSRERVRVLRLWRRSLASSDACRRVVRSSMTCRPRVARSRFDSVGPPRRRFEARVPLEALPRRRPPPPPNRT